MFKIFSCSCHNHVLSFFHTGKCSSCPSTLQSSTQALLYSDVKKGERLNNGSFLEVGKVYLEESQVKGVRKGALGVTCSAQNHLFIFAIIKLLELP